MKVFISSEIPKTYRNKLDLSSSPSIKLLFSVGLKALPIMGIFANLIFPLNAPKEFKSFKRVSVSLIEAIL